MPPGPPPVTWRNSFVFHSLDKVTSVFIHSFPALLTYVHRWDLVRRPPPLPGCLETHGKQAQKDFTHRIGARGFHFPPSPSLSKDGTETWLFVLSETEFQKTDSSWLLLLLLLWPPTLAVCKVLCGRK